MASRPGLRVAVCSWEGLCAIFVKEVPKSWSPLMSVYGVVLASLFVVCVYVCVCVCVCVCVVCVCVCGCVYVSAIFTYVSL